MKITGMVAFLLIIICILVLLGIIAIAYIGFLKVCQAWAWMHGQDGR